MKKSTKSKIYSPRDFLKIWLWILFLDFTSTFVALNLVDGLAEYNPIMAFFFSMGALGWLYAILFGAGVMWLVALACSWLINNAIRNKRLAYVLAVSIYAVMNIIVVINNVRLILTHS